MSTILTIDPGLSGTGLAFWDKQDWVKAETLYPISFEDIKPAKEQKMFARIMYLALKNEVEKVYMENASSFDSYKGRVCAKSGGLVKLAQFIGGLKTLLISRGIYVELISVMRWKGNLPKYITKGRVLRHYPVCAKASSHVIDAIGIGLSLRGKI